MTYLTYADLGRDAKLLARKLRGKIGVVCGVPRSGMLPAAIVATELNLPLHVPRIGCIGGGSRARNLASEGPVALVDDCAHTGNAMSRNGRSGQIPACVYASSLAIKKIPGLVYARKVEEPRIYEWNLWNCRFLKDALFDMDGVLCEEPVKDDDGPLYAASIASLPPLYIPTPPIMGIVTNRLEKWRSVTREWLNRHGVQCRGLYMRPFQDIKERSAGLPTAQWKGRMYAQSDAALFIESSDKQARTIAAISGKPCLSIEANCLY